VYRPDEYTEAEREHFNGMRVVILCPVMHHYPRFWQSVANMVAYSHHYGLRVEELAMTERTVVDWAREELAEQALSARSRFDDAPFTHFLWLDSDHVFNRDLALELARHDVEAVSAVYFNRQGDPKPVVYCRNENDPAGLSHFPLLNLPPQLVQVDAFGFGACLVKREVFERVPKPWFVIDHRGGEDIQFCAKARTHGVQFWADGRYYLGHFGDPQIVGWDDYRRWYEANRDTMAKGEVKLTARPVL
jgi:hypothetical protein